MQISEICDFPKDFYQKLIHDIEIPKINLERLKFSFLNTVSKINKIKLIKPILLIVPLFSLIFLFVGIKLSEAEISFLAIADSPYSNKAYYLIEKELENLPEKAKFIIHLGDIKHKQKICEENDYKDFSDLFKRSPLPVFTIPGDNDYSICENSSQAKRYYDQYIFQFEKNWKLNFLAKRQKEQQENFTFFLEHTLFIGIKHFEKRTTEKVKFNKILQNNISWIKENLKQHKDQVETMVIFAHDFSGLRDKNSIYEVCGKIQLSSWEADRHYKPFSDQLVTLAQNFKKPILYMQGNHHCWVRDRPYKDAKNIERFVVGTIEKHPLVKFTINDSKLTIDKRRNKRNYLFLNEAKLGSVWSQYFLGLEYLKSKDFKNAKKWFLKASNKNFPPAQVSLGEMLRDDNSESTNKKYKEAIRLFKSSVQTTDLYIDSFNKKYKKKLELYQNRIIKFKREIIKQSQYDSFFSLGLLHSLGLGIPQSYEKALGYYKKASKGVGNAYYNIAVFYMNGQGVNKDFKEAKNWCVKGSKQGVRDCRFMLGFLSLNGLGTQKDYKEAAKWFIDAGNHTPSLYNLGLLYIQGLGVDKDINKAISFLTNAAKNGSSKAKTVLENLNNLSKK